MNFKPITTSIMLLSALCGCTPSWKDENECIARSLQGVTGDRAANLVANACRDQFSSKPDAGNWTDLPAADSRLVTGWVRVSDDKLSGILYNGSSRYVTQITVAIKSQNGAEPAASAPQKTTRLYRIIVSPVAPLQVGNFTAQLGPNSENDGWEFENVKGTTTAPR